tara:strand:+ start:431 stop:1333 length:903 start_codon:yes stop_codon:yes gene_type:complete
MSLNTKKVIFIIGPTAIGKTALSIKLAKTFNTDIISCDSRQFYKELKIGTSPPSIEELSEIKHHFIHNISIKKNYNAGKFEIDAINQIQKLHKTKDIVIVVGGSGLYVNAICNGFDKMPEISEKIRNQINIEYQNKGLTWLQEKVKNIDPSYTDYEIKNPQRLLRALEVFQETGRSLSSFKSNKIKKRSFETLKIGLYMDREILYERINNRVDTMIKEGLIEEVKSLTNDKYKNALQTVGYKEIFAFLNNECTLRQAIEDIKRNTRRLAKRQITWFKKEKDIKWFRPDEIADITETILKL